MSNKITATPMYVRDKTTGQLVPISMIASGSDKTLAQIKQYADEVKTGTEAELEAKKKKVLGEIPESYTEVAKEISELSESIVQINSSGLFVKDGVLYAGYPEEGGK